MNTARATILVVGPDGDGPISSRLHSLDELQRRISDLNRRQIIASALSQMTDESHVVVAAVDQSAQVNRLTAGDYVVACPEEEDACDSLHKLLDMARAKTGVTVCSQRQMALALR